MGKQRPPLRSQILKMWLSANYGELWWTDWEWNKHVKYTEPFEYEKILNLTYIPYQNCI